MLQAMFSGVTGLQAHQTKMNVLGNNIANVNTVGFKAGRVTFQEQISQNLRSSSQPGEGSGGQNPMQVGLGVSLGGVDTLLTQGNLQSTGKASDLAIQGNGYFLVTEGEETFFTRDGTFDLDSAGSLSSPANGMKLLGYMADDKGEIDFSQPLTADSQIKISVGTLYSTKPTSEAKLEGNLNAVTAVQSTQVDFEGNLNTSQVPAPLETTVRDSLGNPHKVILRLTDPTTTGLPAGVQQRWTVNFAIDGVNAALPASPLYMDGVLDGDILNYTLTDGAGASLGTALPLSVKGTGKASDFQVNVDLAGIQTAVTTPASNSLQATSDGQIGADPVWNNSVRVYDSIGKEHTLNFRFSHATLGADAPSDAKAQWNWEVLENGKKILDSTATGNSPLYFNAHGGLVNINPLSLKIPYTEVDPMDIKVDIANLTQLAGDSTVTSTSQDGFPVGNLQTYKVSSEGLITGIFSNGQTRTLGQIAMSSFSNPSGLEKLGQNLYRSSSNSGLPQVGLAGQNGRGKISAGVVEMSNVDLATEFTNLIVTQRGFQANTRIVSVVDEMLQEMINLRR